MNNRYDYIFKVIILGDEAIGKTTLIHRYLHSNFLMDTKMTIGVNIENKKISFNLKNAIMQIWDFAGEEHFRFLQDSFTLGAKGMILCFDLTRLSSFLNLEDWLNPIKQEIPIILIGTKNDLNDKCVISKFLINNFKKRFDIQYYFSTSSKTGINVENAFNILVKLMFNEIKEKKEIKKIKI